MRQMKFTSGSMIQAPEICEAGDCRTRYFPQSLLVFITQKMENQDCDNDFDVVLSCKTSERRDGLVEIHPAHRTRAVGPEAGDGK